MKLLCIAAMIDLAHETKLKALRFVDKMQPVLLKSKTLVMMKWIIYHSHFVKLEMGDQFFCKNSGQVLMKKCLKEMKKYSKKSL